MTIVLFIALIIVSLVLIVAVLMQQGQRQGLGAIAGGAETFLGKGKAKGIDAKLAKITKIATVVFIVLAIVTTILVAQKSNAELAAQEAAQEAAYQEMLAALPEEDRAAIEAGEAYLSMDGSVVYYEDVEAALTEEAATEEAAEETPAEEAVVEETAAEEAPVEEAATEETAAE